jgi:hypothetical protein
MDHSLVELKDQTFPVCFTSCPLHKKVIVGSCYRLVQNVESYSDSIRLVHFQNINGLTVGGTATGFMSFVDSPQKGVWFSKVQNALIRKFKPDTASAVLTH